MTEQPRSKLSNRLAAAASRITATRVTGAQQAAPTAPAPTRATPDADKPARNTKPASTRSKPTNPTATNQADAQATRAKGKGGSDEDRGFEGSPSARAASGSIAIVAASLRAQARNPDALQLVSDDELVEIARAMVENAKQRGSTGAMDRQALFRAAGLPFVSSGTGKGGPGATGPVVRDRLERAVQRTRRQPGVTPRADDGPEAMETAA